MIIILEGSDGGMFFSADNFQLGTWSSLSFGAAELGVVAIVYLSVRSEFLVQ